MGSLNVGVVGVRPERSGRSAVCSASSSSEIFPSRNSSPWRRSDRKGVPSSSAVTRFPSKSSGPDAFRGLDVALFSAGAGVSREMAPIAVDAGAVVVDNSSAFRMDADKPLVVPEVNPDALANHGGIIANPNCSTIILVVAIAPIHRRTPIERVTVATYQAASGAGAKGMDALGRELEGETLESSPFPHRLAGNLIPRIDVLQENGYTKEEMKMVLETQKILGIPDLPVSATCVRVPVARAHSEAVQVTTRDPLTVGEIRSLLSSADGVQVQDDAANDVYPTPIAVTEQDDVFVGRVRVHPSDPAHVRPLGRRRPDSQGRRAQRRADRRASVRVASGRTSQTHRDGSIQKARLAPRRPAGCFGS